MKNIEIKDIINIKKINSILNTFKEIKNNSKKSIWNSIVNVIYEEPVAFFITSGLNLLFSAFIVDFLSLGNLTFFLIFTFISFIFILSKINFIVSCKKINFNYNKIYHLIYNKKIREKQINEINNILLDINEKDKKLAESILEKDPVIDYSPEYISYVLLKSKLNTMTIEEIREDKDIIFNFIQKEINNHSQQSYLLDLLEERLKEMTVNERVQKINNTFKKYENDDNDNDKVTLNNKIIQSI